MTFPTRAVRRLAAAIALALGTLALPAVVAPTAQAADNGAWSVTPKPASKSSPTPRNYFILEGSPGDLIEDSVRIQNWTKKPISFRVYGADGYNTPQDGFFALKEFDDKHTDVGAWTKPVSTLVTVHGRMQVDIPVRIRIPKNATPGDHVGGVVAKNVDVEALDEDKSVAVGIQRAVASRMYIRVSGTTSPGFEVSDVRLTHDRGAWPWAGRGSGTVQYTIKNTGNLRLSPKGTVTVSGLFADKATHDVELIDLLPGQKVTLRQKITGIPSIGRVVADVDLSAGDALSDSGTTAKTLLPWPFLVLLLILLGALGAWLKRRSGVLRRKLRDAEVAPKISVSTGGPST